MSANEIHVGDAGTLFTFTVKDSGASVDISTATLTGMIELRKPSGTVTTLTAAFSASGTDGVILYTSTTSDFEEVGKHKFQIIINDSVNKWHSDLYEFKVFANLT